MQTNSTFSAAKPTLSPAELYDQRDRVTLIDVRDPSEFAGEHIPGAQLRPLSRFNPDEVGQQVSSPIVVYCRTGTRSASAAQALRSAGYTNVQELAGGLLAWQAAGYDVQRNPRAPISIMRQVQIVAGSLVVSGTLLGAIVSPWFLLLSGFVGAGLVFAGVSNTCAMARLLAKLPYNQPR